MSEESLENYKILIPYYDCYPEVLLIEVMDALEIESLISNKGKLYKNIQEYRFKDNMKINTTCKWEGGAYQYFIGFYFICDYRLLKLSLFQGLKKYLKENQDIDLKIEKFFQVPESNEKYFEFSFKFFTYEDRIGNDNSYIELIAERFEFYILHEVFPIFEKYKLELTEDEKANYKRIYDSAKGVQE